MSQASIDYLTIRIMSCSSPDHLVRSILELDYQDFKPCNAVNHYRNAIRSGNISVLYNGTSQMGMCVSMSGEGCREYCRRTNDRYALLKLLQRLDVSDAVTRLDIAYDDKDGQLDLNTLREKIKLQEVKTRLDSQREFGDLRKAEVRTLYLGSEQSEYRVRFYNKAAESGQNGHWIRAEETLSGNLAKQFVIQFRNSTNADTPLERQEDQFFQQGAQLFLRKIAFLEARKENVTRSDICKWWTGFLGTAVPIDSLLVKGESDFEKKESWFRNSYSRSLAAWTLILGADWLVDLLLTGIRANFNSSHSRYRELSAAYMQEGKVPVMNLNADSERKCLEAIRMALEHYLTRER